MQGQLHMQNGRTLAAGIEYGGYSAAAYIHDLKSKFALCAHQSIQRPFSVPVFASTVTFATTNGSCASVSNGRNTP